MNMHVEKPVADGNLKASPTSKTLCYEGMRRGYVVEVSMRFPTYLLPKQEFGQTQERALDSGRGSSMGQVSRSVA